MRVLKYTEQNLETALLKMFDGGISTSNKNKLIQARKFPKNVANSYDLFKSYFLSEEGLPSVISKLSEKEIALLHILNFNKWKVNASVFEGLYKAMPSSSHYYYARTFTQEYGDVLKSIQKRLVNQGLLIQYESKTGGNSKAERQRFIFPPSFADYLPSPITDLKKIPGKGSVNEENLRIDLMNAVLGKQKRNVSVIELKSKKLTIKQHLIDLPALDSMQFKQWGHATSATILYQQFMGYGVKFSEFLLHHLQKLPSNHWFSATSLTPLLEVWNDPKKRKAFKTQSNSKNPYEEHKFCEMGWKNNVLEQIKANNKNFYKLTNNTAESIPPEKYLSLNNENNLAINFNKIPMDALVVLNHFSHFQAAPKPPIFAIPDLSNLSTISAEMWKHPLIDWLKNNAPNYKKTFDFFHKNYGKEIVHDNLLVARITDLTLRVLVEKNLGKHYEVIALSNEYLAFPKEALATVEKIVAKSGNVIKQG